MTDEDTRDRLAEFEHRLHAIEMLDASERATAKEELVEELQRGEADLDPDHPEVVKSHAQLRQVLRGLKQALRGK